MPPLPPEGITLHGGCDCSAVQYKISIPPLSSRPIAFEDKKTGQEPRYPQSFLDHCNRCRRVSGAIVQAWLTVPQDWVEWVQTQNQGKQVISTTRELIEHPKANEPHSLAVTNYMSSPGVVRSFCGRCGTNLSFVDQERDMGGDGKVATVDIVLGSLENDSFDVEGVRPDRHLYWDSGVEWVKTLVTEGDGGLIGGKKAPKHPDGERDVFV
ncbi:Mss4-like protein [Rhexocercosporidium sp. MPI-PUGE-AT-0058]|nr:Mss4-like protein [Rhexocercosporidium sp. MPI-PUGE-AT-0058]